MLKDQPMQHFMLLSELQDSGWKGYLEVLFNMVIKVRRGSDENSCEGCVTVGAIQTG